MGEPEVAAGFPVWMRRQMRREDEDQSEFWEKVIEVHVETCLG